MAKKNKNAVEVKAPAVAEVVPVAPVVPVEPSKTAAERKAELVESSLKTIGESASVFTTPHEPVEGVDLGDLDPVAEMTLEEVEAEIKLIGDPHAVRIAIGAYRGTLIAARDKAVEAMNNLIGVAEDEIHDSRQPEGVLSNRVAALQKAKAEFEQAALADAERMRSDAEGERVAKEARKKFGPHVPGALGI